MGMTEETRKIVTNRCFGGFSLSLEGVLAYAERKGITVYPEKSKFGFWTYWTVPESERPQPQDNWWQLTQEQRAASNAAYGAATLNDRDIPRDDEVLVALVEEMPERVSGKFAKLTITEIPADVDWVIEEYDGSEWVAERHRTW